MWELSSEARTVIASLWQVSDIRQMFGRRMSWNVAGIEQLGSMNEPAALAYLVRPLFSDQADAKRAAAKAIKSLLALIGVDDLVRLDESMRPRWVDDDWRKLPARELAQVVGPGEPGAIALELASMHPNGFVREQAVLRLALRNDGSELPYLLLRLNDWVVQVRRAAIDAVYRRLTTDYARHFARVLVLAARLEQASRDDHREILNRIYGLLTSDAARQPMLEALAGDSRSTRRASYRILMRPGSTGIADVVAVAVKSRDPIIRLWATRSLPGVLVEPDLRVVVGRLLGDSSVPVRREAIRIWITAFNESAEDVLTRALLDGSPSMRAFARFHLAKNGQSWFRRFYLDAVTSDQVKALSNAIAGLAETGAPDDAAVLVRFLAHPSARVRAAAVRYLIRLGGEQFLEATFEHVMDPSPGVSSRARQAAQGYIDRIGAQRLWRSFSAPNPPHVRRNLLVLVRALPKWDAVSCLLEATLDGDPFLSELAREYVVLWNARFNASHAVPTVAQLAAARAALSAATNALPPSTAASIALSLRSFDA